MDGSPACWYRNKINKAGYANAVVEYGWSWRQDSWSHFNFTTQKRLAFMHVVGSAAAEQQIAHRVQGCNMMALVLQFEWLVSGKEPKSGGKHREFMQFLISVEK